MRPDLFDIISGDASASTFADYVARLEESVEWVRDALENISEYHGWCPGVHRVRAGLQQMEAELDESTLALEAVRDAEDYRLAAEQREEEKMLRDSYYW